MGRFTGRASASSSGSCAVTRRVSPGRCAIRVHAGVTLATIALNIYLFVIVPKGFFPQQDTGRLAGSIQAAQDISFQVDASKSSRSSCRIVQSDPAVETVMGFNGARRYHETRRACSSRSKPLEERRLSADQVIARLRGKLATVPGATLYLQSVQDVRIGGRSSSAQYQFTLQGESLAELDTWAPRLIEKLRALPRACRCQQRSAGPGPQCLSGNRPRHGRSAGDYVRS